MSVEATGCRTCRSDRFVLVGARQNEGHVSIRFSADRGGGIRIVRSGVDVSDNSVEAMAGARGWTIEYHVDRNMPGAGERSGRHVCLCGSQEVQLVLNAGERVSVERGAA